VLEILLKNKIIDEKTVGMVREFISNNQTGGSSPPAPGKNFLHYRIIFISNAKTTQNHNVASKDGYI
jgi:hypothetical protein